MVRAKTRTAIFGSGANGKGAESVFIFIFGLLFWVIFGWDGDEDGGVRTRDVGLCVPGREGQEGGFVRGWVGLWSCDCGREVCRYMLSGMMSTDVRTS